MRFPQLVSDFLFQSAREFTAALTENKDMPGMGRLKIIFDAIALVKKEIGNDVVISGMIPGPYTLLLYLCHPRNLFIEMKKDPQPVVDAVFLLSSFLSKLGTAYRNAGADFITIHEMAAHPFHCPPNSTFVSQR